MRRGGEGLVEFLPRGQVPRKKVPLRDRSRAPTRSMGKARRGSRGRLGTIEPETRGDKKSRRGTELGRRSSHSAEESSLEGTEARKFSRLLTLVSPLSSGRLSYSPLTDCFRLVTFQGRTGHSLSRRCRSARRREPFSTPTSAPIRAQPRLDRRSSQPKPSPRLIIADRSRPR